jgi:DNA-binding SARP family transcriptional activator
MKQTVFSQKGRPLLTYAISKLNPEVFSHPVWVRFGNKGKTLPPETIQALFREAEGLQRDHPGDACQVWLMCAAHLNYSGQSASALASTQKARNLAERSGLAQEMLWSIWGACAICVQERNYEQASIHLAHLQAVLHEQNEWVLADYIDVLRQIFPFSSTTDAEDFAQSADDQQLECMLSLTYHWLHQWGSSAQSDQPIALERPIAKSSPQELITGSLLSAEVQPGPWHTLKLMFTGELKLGWTRHDLPHKKDRSSFWDSAVRRLRFYFSGREADAGMNDVPAQLPSPSPPQKSIDSLSDNSPPRPEADARNKQSERNQLLIQPDAVIPVSVHMLGRFVMCTQDTELRLPGSRSLSLLKYLILHHKQTIPREVLMDVFWPNAAPETARNNLNVAMHAIRKALHPMIDVPVILYRDGAYSIAPHVQLWLDVEEFERLVYAGQRLESRNQSTAVSEYETAVSLYQGDFLQENPYEEWTVLERERLRASYLDTLDRLSQIYFRHEQYAACITACRHILSHDLCREDTHCLLMRCYSRQGQQHLALRQYQVCVGALRLELDVSPLPATTQLFEHIRQHRPV